MKKCAKCGGAMYRTGGSTMKTKLDIASKPKIYGIPQTGGTGNITAKNGGAVKKKLVKAQKGAMVPYGNESFGPSSGSSRGTMAMQVGGPKKTTVKMDALTYKRDSTNYANAANKYLNPKNTKEYNEGRDSLNAIKKRYGTPNALENKMQRTVGGYDIKKKGGSVVKLTKKQDGGANKSQPNPNSPTTQASYSKYDAVRNSASAMRKKTAPGPVVTPPTNTPVKKRGGSVVSKIKKK